MSFIRKLFYACTLALIAANPLTLSANHKQGFDNDRSDAEGIYQFSGFVSSNSGSQAAQPSSSTQTFVGQLKLTFLHLEMIRHWRSLSNSNMAS